MAGWAGQQIRIWLTRLAHRRHLGRGLLAGGLAGALAVLAHLLLPRSAFPFLAYYPAVAIATLFGGALAGLLLVAGSALAVGVLASAQPGLGLLGEGGLGFAGFLVLGGIEVLLLDQLLVALALADASQRRAQDAVAFQGVMFQEFQHRIANGLMAMTSLLTLEARRLRQGEADAAAALQETAQRLGAMSRLHRRMYDLEAAQQDFPGVVQDICRELKEAFGAHAVTLVVEVPPLLPLGLDRLFPLALIVAEAVTNSLKHAFAGREGGALQVRITVEDAAVQLLVHDDGPGLPPTLQPGNGQGGIGMLVLSSLAQRLGGTLNLSSENGAVIRVTVPLAGQSG